MRFIYAIILMGISFTIHAQRKLTGIITASDTKLPIVSANVYLNNTSVGTVSNNLGEFELPHAPLGPFDLVVSYLGYETFKIEVDLAKLTSPLKIVLIPKVNELQEVIVEAYDKDGWEKWGTLFIETFIGSSSFANDCYLQNKEVLRFRLNKKKNTLKVVADDRILIENRALGYLLKYDLTAFEFNLSTKEFYFGGYPFFEELETTKKRVEKKYIENRREAYYGSITHFMRSVYRNKIVEQGFKVRKEVLVSWDERQRVKELVKLHPEKISQTSFLVDTNLNKANLLDTIKALPNDSSEYYKKVMALSRNSIQPVLLNQVLPGDSIAFAVDSATCGFDFTGRISIKYLPKKNPPAYQKFVPRDQAYQVVNSVLYRISDKLIQILANGSYLQGQSLMINGYWAWWEKMCNKLPFEYSPSATITRNSF